MKLRADQKLQIDPRQDLNLYINDLHPYDYSDLKQTAAESDESEDSDDLDKNSNSSDDSEADSLRAQNPFTVRAFCLTENGQSVSVDILGFQPYFYIKIPENWGQGHLAQLADRLRQLVYYQNRPGLLNIRKVLGKPFSHFTGDQKFQYAKLIFRNYQSFKSYSYCFNQPIKIPGLFRNGHKFQVFESNITPLLRLIHEKNIKPSGWIRLPGTKYHIDELFIDPKVQKLCRRIPSIKLSEEPHGNSFCQGHLEINWQLLESLPDKLEIPAIIYAAYDIEADSSHGDFPLAKKTYQKLARELIQATQYAQTHQLSERNFGRGASYQHSYHVQRDIRSQTLRWLELAFDPYYRNNGIRQLALSQPICDPDLSYDEQYHHLNELTQSTIKPLVESTLYPLADAYHLARLKNSPTENLIDQIHVSLETHLPLLNLEFPGTDYRSLGLQLVQEYHNALIRNLLIVKRSPVECLIRWLSLAFDPHYNGEEISHVYTKKEQIPDSSVLANLTPKVLEYCLKAVNNTEIEDPHNDPHQDQDDDEDTEATESQPTTYEMLLGDLLTKHLPTVLGDQVIQIGTTFKRYGETDCFLKHIITLDTCAKIQNCDLIADEHKSVKLPKKVMLQEIKTWMSDGLELLAKQPNRHISKYLIDRILDFVNLDYIPLPELNNSNTSQSNTSQSNTSQSNTSQSNTSQSNTSQSINPPRSPLITQTLDLVELNRVILEKRCQKQLLTDHAEVIVESYATEREVLLAWTRLIQRSDPELVIGFNTFGFDFKFLYHRAEVLGCLEEFNQLGRFRGYHQELKEQKLSSGGLGDNLLYYIPMYGRVLIDLFKVVQANYKLSSYKLDSVCKEFMYMSKNDLPPKELFILQKGTIEDRTKIARYCLIDCVLCNRLIDKLEIITNNIGMSNVCSVPLSYLFLRGQGIKILSLVSKICAQEGFLLPVLKKPKRKDDKTKATDDEDDGGFEGAIVLPAKKGVKFEPTVVNDFNSLYPSCMISENLSHDSFVIIDSEWDNLPNYEYVSITYDVFEEVPTPPGKKKPKHPKKIKVGQKTCKFAQLPGGQKSMLPRILQYLLKARKDTRKEQKKFAKGSFSWNVLEGLQLAYKVTANSLYGQTGAVTSDISKKEIAACTTATGRKLIHFTRDFFETNYPGCTTVYGDSVTGPTPILCRRPDGLLEYLTAETLGNGEWTPYHDTKEACPPRTGYQVWSDLGFTTVNRVIRHRTDKNIIRVLTHTGLVEVTEDHSLLDPQGNKVKPSDLSVGDWLLHKDLCSIGILQLNKDKAYVMGLFYADGSCGEYVCKSGKKSSWAINNADKDLIADVLLKCQSSMPELNFKILETMERHTIYKLIAQGNVNHLVAEWRELFYCNRGYKKVPTIILNSARDVKSAFMDGYYAGTHTSKNKDTDTRNDYGYYKYDNNGQIGSAGLYHLSNALGYKCGLNDRSDRLNFLRITCSKKSHQKNPNKIKKLTNLGLTSDYVYDLETENHHFSAGVGRLIVHNTDSCFNSFVCKDIFGNPLKGLDAIYRSMEYAVEGSLAISRQLKPPHNLEFEKAIDPFLLISKKRYTGLYYTEVFSPQASIKSMGIVLKRRDNAQIVKKVFGQILDIIIYEQDLEKALNDGRRMVEKVLNGEFPMEDFVISKTIRGWYKNPDRIAHAVLARRIAQRDPGNRPQSNDRIPYSFVKIPENRDKSVKVLQGDRIETPEFIKEHDLKLDYRYYVEKQIMKPVCQIFDLTEYDGQRYIFDEPLMDYDRRLKGIRKISEFFKPRAQNAIPRLAKFKKLSQFVPVKKAEIEELDALDAEDHSNDSEYPDDHSNDSEDPDDVDDPDADDDLDDFALIEESEDDFADDEY